jgi:hypothetical protein
MVTAGTAASGQKRPSRNWELGLLFVGHFIVTVDYAQATTVEVDLRHVHVPSQIIHPDFR